MRCGVRRLLSGGALALLASMAGLAPASDRLVGLPFATRSEVIAPHAMAATSQPLATQIALDVMRRGGSAVDAAIAANAALGLMEPTGSGIGGDLFAIIWDAKTQRLYGLNGSGRAPQALSLTQLRAELTKRGLSAIPPRGELPLSVPGAVDAWFTMHKRFGRLPMQQLLQPTIEYARAGFPVSEVIADGLERNARVLAKYPGFQATYMRDGRMPAKGELFRNPRLANTLERIARGGRDAFYRGDIPRAIEAYVKAQGGFLGAADFLAHHSDWVEPITTSYRGYDVWELPPNGQGLAALQMLNILEGYDLKSMGFASPDYVHVFTEAKKLAFEDRAKYYADPAFVKTPVQQLLAKSYAAQRRALISMSAAAQSYPAGDAKLQQGDTIYLTVADPAGNMVSLIQSNYRGMGSGMTPANLGFVLQNRAEAFSVQDGHANVYAPGKRPFHTIIPAFVTHNGKPWLSFGVMGGAMQPQGHVQIIVNVIDFGMNLQEAGDAPRMRHDGSSDPDGSRMTAGGEIVLETAFASATVEALRARGHKVRVANDGDYGGYQAIGRDAAQTVYIGASESRKDGQAAGY